MSHDVFVSYPSVDKVTADGVVAALESHGLRCWYAPRDVIAGADWAGSIVQAIRDSQLVVLVFSEAANASDHILREVRQAADARIPIIPFRISPEAPNSSLEYYIGGTHWLDALTRPLEDHLEQLVETAQRILGEEPSSPRSTQRVPKGLPPVTTPSVPQGFTSIRSWLGGLPRLTLGVAIAVVVLAVAGAVALISKGGETAAPVTAAPVTVAPTVSSTSASGDTAPAATSSAPEEASDWRPLSFMIPNPQLWDVSGDDRFTAVDQSTTDAFAWSTEDFEGDLTVSLELESSGSESSGCVIVYGNGLFHGYGSLIFCVEWDFFTLEKHTTDHGGENFVFFSPSGIGFGDEVYSVTIDIRGDVATMLVDGQKVLSTVFDATEIERRGRIGLHKKFWIDSEVTFSDIQIRTPADVESVATIPEGDECELDTGSQPNHYPIESPFISHSIEVDGGITSSAEWEDAPCIDVRMHYGINATNPNFQRTRWWVQHDAQDVFFLFRVPKELAVRGAFVNYFWPEYVGTWAHSDGVYVTVDGETFDQGLWDELRWVEDVELNPPGTIDAEAVPGEDGEFHWFEIRRPLNSGDTYDWAFEPGQTYGNNPYDSVMIGIETDEGVFLRYLQLELAAP